MKDKEELVTMQEMMRRYFTHCYFLCDRNKTEVSRRLKISVRTVKNYCTEYKLPPRLTSRVRRMEPVKPIEEYSSDFNCMDFITGEERDRWYNKDYY